MRSKFMQKAIDRITPEERALMVATLKAISDAHAFSVEPKLKLHNQNSRMKSLWTWGYCPDINDCSLKRRNVSDKVSSKTPITAFSMKAIDGLPDEYFNSFINAAKRDMQFALDEGKQFMFTGATISGYQWVHQMSDEELQRHVSICDGGRSLRSSPVYDSSNFKVEFN